MLNTINGMCKVLKPKQIVGGIPAETIHILQQHGLPQTDIAARPVISLLKKNPINNRVKEWFGTMHTFQKGTHVPQMLQKQ